MKPTLSKIAWLFIAAVAVYDVYYSYHMRAYMAEIESNPVAAYVLSFGGIWWAIGYRAIWLAYAGLLLRTRTRFTPFITPAWTLGHLLLAVQYCRILAI